MADARALKILLDAYWGPKGWKTTYDDNFVAQPPSIDPADFAYAKSRGVMFDPLHIGRADALERARRAVGALRPEQVGQAFAASLGSQRLELRSPLGSYAIARQLPTHDCLANEHEEGWCTICGQFDRNGDEFVDLNEYNVERYKWGGVNHDEVVYRAFDLELFAREEWHAPTTEDVRILTEIIQAASCMASRSGVRDLERSLAAVVPWDKPQRESLLGILGYCGVLEPAGRPSYFRQFTHKADIPDPPDAKNDWAYPVAWWRGSDGVNAEAVRFWFGWAGLG